MTSNLSIDAQNISRILNNANVKSITKNVNAKNITKIRQKSGLKQVGVKAGKYVLGCVGAFSKAGLLASTGIPVDVLDLSKKSTKDALNVGALIVKNFVRATLKIK